MNDLDWKANDRGEKNLSVIGFVHLYITNMCTLLVSKDHSALGS